MKSKETKPNKTYQFKGKTVIAVPETRTCDGCCFVNEDLRCQMNSYAGALDFDLNQKANGMPDCVDNKIIFKLATDQK